MEEDDPRTNEDVIYTPFDWPGFTFHGGIIP